LLARIRAVLRRSVMSPRGLAPGVRRLFEFAGWRLDVTHRQLRSPANALVDLRPAEFELLLAFVEHPQQILKRERLLELARGNSAASFDRSIDVHISRLRQRLEADPKEPVLIKTVRGEGYVFAAPVKVNGATW